MKQPWLIAGLLFVVGLACAGTYFAGMFASGDVVEEIVVFDPARAPDSGAATQTGPRARAATGAATRAAAIDARLELTADMAPIVLDAVLGQFPGDGVTRIDLRIEDPAGHERSHRVVMERPGVSLLATLGDVAAGTYRLRGEVSLPRVSHVEASPTLTIRVRARVLVLGPIWVIGGLALAFLGVVVAIATALSGGRPRPQAP